MKAEVGVVVCDSEVLCGIVLPVHSVADVGVVRNGLKSVQKARGNKEGAQLDIVESERLKLAERRRTPPDIDQDIVYRTTGASHQLGFTSIGAAVHAPNDTTSGTRLRVLDEVSGRAVDPDGRVKGLRVEGAGEETAPVVKRLRNEEQHICKLCRLYEHDRHLLTPLADLIGKEK
jgi:hypothetical protein